MGQGLAIQDNLSASCCQSLPAKSEQFSLRNVPTTFQQSLPLPSLHAAPNTACRSWPRAVGTAEASRFNKTRTPSPVTARGSCCSHEFLRD